MLADEVACLQQRLQAAEGEERLLSCRLAQAERQAEASQQLLMQVEAQLSGGSSTESLHAGAGQLASSSADASVSQQQRSRAQRPARGISDGDTAGVGGPARTAPAPPRPRPGPGPGTTSQRLRGLLAHHRGRQHQQPQNQPRTTPSRQRDPAAGQPSSASRGDVVEAVSRLQAQVCQQTLDMTRARQQATDAQEQQRAAAAAEAGSLQAQLLGERDAVQELRRRLHVAQAAEAAAAERAREAAGAAACAQESLAAAQADAQARLEASNQRHRALQVG